MPKKRDWTRFIRPIVITACVVGAVIWVAYPYVKPRPSSPQLQSTPMPANIPDAPIFDGLDQADPLIQEMVRDAVGHVNEDRSDANRWLTLAMIYHANDHLELALQCYEQSIAIDGSEPRSWYLRALIEQRQGNAQTAIDHMRRSIDLDGTYSPAYWRIGQWFLDAGDLAQAQEWFVRATSVDPSSDGGWIGQVRVSLQRNEPQRSLELIQRHLLLTPNDDYARQLQANALGDLQRHNEARVEAARGRLATPVLGDPHSTFMMEYKTGFEAKIDHSNALLASGRFEETIQLLSPLRQVWPNDPKILNNLGMAYLHDGQVVTALSVLKLSERANPDLPITQISLALAYEKQAATVPGSLDMAIQHCQRAIELQPQNSKAHETKAFLHVQRGEYDQAIQPGRRAIEYDPDNASLSLNLARVLRQQHDFDGAIELLSRAIDLAPASLQAQVELAHVYLDRKSLSQAEAVLEQAGRWAIPNDPTLRQARLRLLNLRNHSSEDDWSPHLAEFMAIAQRLENSNNPYLGRGRMKQLQRELAQRAIEPKRRLALEVRLTLELLQHAEIPEAKRYIESAVRMAQASPQLQDRLPQLYRIRAIAHLRQAEISNCVLRHNAECCIFPLQSGGIHAVQSPAHQARLDFQRYLESDPDNLSARWLLNLANMALGEYPQGVPERYLIPPEAFESDYDIGRFPDVASKLGINTLNLCGGCIVDDFDNDNLLDIVTTTFDPQGPATFYRNVGDGSFEDVSARSKINDQLGGLNCVGADYDSDGDVDILILRGAWLFDDGRIRNSLLRNNGDATFTDVTHKAGMIEAPAPTQAAVWSDFDNDGDLDVFIGNESRADAAIFAPDQARGGNYPSHLYSNNGDGTFTDIALAAGVTNDRYCKGVTAGDFDNDGDQDLFVSNIGSNRLYRNNGDGTFTDVAQELGVSAPEDRSFAAWFFDYDNDGWLDLFVGAYDAGLDDIAADYLGLEYQATDPCLYRNTGASGKPGFINVTKQVGLDHPYLPMGANFGDLDNDGFLDIYLATGEPDVQALMPNIMLRNDGGKRFQDVTMSGGLGHLQKGHGVAFADIDHDGDQDIYHQLGGFYPGDQFHNALFVNPGHGNRWLTIQLKGTTTNRSGVGVRIKVAVQTPSGRREIHRAAGSVSSFGGSPRRQEIGLGDATRIESVELFWPTSGRRQMFNDVPLDTMIKVVEDSDRFEIVERESFRLE